MIKAIIVDDELKSCQNMEKLITEFCPEVKIMAVCQSVDAGIAAIKEHKPDMIFLDVQMKGETGFDLLEKVKPIDFEIVFATAHSEHGVKAFRFSAIDYLLKPIDVEELKSAVAKVVQRQNFFLKERIETLVSHLRPTKPNLLKLAIPAADGLVFIKIGDILYCEASGNYTTFFINDGKKYMVSRTLKEYDDMLSDHDFFRVHNSHLINLNSIKKYIRGDGGQVVMSNDAVLDVAKRKKEGFLKRIAR
jgi:two-component system, LytTR family, response regulator